MKLNISEIKVAILGGLIAQIAFEAYAWLISPFVFGPKLQPAFLVIGLFKQFAGVTPSYAVAFSLHALIGVVGFGLFTLMFYKAFRGRAILSGFIAGLVLWFIAQGMLAPAMGREFMMGFGAYTQSSFVSHVGMSLIIALFFHYRFRKDQTAEA